MIGVAAQGPAFLRMLAYVRARVTPSVALQSALDRRKWQRYGDAAKEQEGDSITVQVTACRYQGLLTIDCTFLSPCPISMARHYMPTPSTFL